MINYEYPADGGYADTVAILEDGRRLYINSQYKEVLAVHAAGCPKGQCEESVLNVCAEGARRRAAVCTCGALHGVVESEILADAKRNGKFGRAPKVLTPAETETEEHGFGWCNKCQSYCYGDCEA